jgi:PAS domain-containing protein
MKSHDVAELAQTLFEEIGDAAFIVDPDTMRLVDVNPMAQRMTGLPRGELLALPVDSCSVVTATKDWRSSSVPYTRPRLFTLRKGIPSTVASTEPGSPST